MLTQLSSPLQGFFLLFHCVGLDELFQFFFVDGIVVLTQETALSGHAVPKLIAFIIHCYISVNMFVYPAIVTIVLVFFGKLIQ